jgi:hypothetical protein
MKPFALVLAVGLAGLAGLLTSPGGAASCGPTTVGGATVLTHCGPAKVTVVFGGRTYRFGGGGCSFDPAVGFWTLLVGRQTLGRATPKFTSFQAALVGKPKAVSYTKLDWTLSFQIPGGGWSLAPGLPHKVTTSAGGKKGTFSGAFYTGSKAGTRHATGSWTC